MRLRSAILPFLGTGAIFSTGCADVATDQKVNIIYILADDMGYGDVSCLNDSSRVQTPNIDRLASEGMVFTDAHTSSSVSTPSRYSILTGRYNWRSTLQNGVGWSYTAPLIDSSRMTIADMLGQNGYRTAVVGKWHLGLGWQRWGSGENDVDFTKPITVSPNDNGFDYSYIMSASLDIPPYIYIENYGFTAPVTDSIEGTTGKGFWREGPIAEDFDITRTLDNFTDKAVQYIADSHGDKPYFLYFPLTAPHTPILPSEEFRGKSGGNEYTDFVMHVDAVVGRIVEVVRASGAEDRTMIIFTSDNGCSLAADLPELAAKGHLPSYIYRGQKADIYDGGHRVPYIVKCPRLVVRGESSAPVCLTNLMATAAEMLGVTLPDSAAEDSFSMLPILTGHESEADRSRTIIHHSIDGNFAIREGDWKLNLCPGSGGWSYPTAGEEPADAPMVQLYNLAENPSEDSSKNLYSAHPEKVKELTDRLTEIIAKGRSTVGEPQQNDTEIDMLKLKHKDL